VVNRPFDLQVEIPHDYKDELRCHCARRFQSDFLEAKLARGVNRTLQHLPAKTEATGGRAKVHFSQFALLVVKLLQRKDSQQVTRGIFDY
jgi:hypothetical protein